jgi:ABC-type Na+ efflux pump permease subunit
VELDMLTGPILARELLAASRQPGSYVARVVIATLLLVTLGTNYYVWEAYTEGVFSVNSLTWYARSCFCSLVAVQGILTVALVPGRVGAAIAEQRERKTLHYLLASDLTSFEIVVGALAARLLMVIAGISAGLPVLALLTLLGGIEPRWVWLAYGGTLSTAYFLGGVAILMSTLARRSRGAINLTLTIAAMWILGPTIVTVIGWFGALPKWLRFLYPIVVDWVLPSTPMGIALYGRSLVEAGPDALIEAVAWMAGLQLAAGSVCVLLAACRLRPTFRAQEAAAGRDATARQRARRWRRACGDDAMLWKETHPPRPGRIGRACSLGFRALVILGVGYTLLHYAAPFAQMWFLGTPAPSWIELDRLALSVHVRSMTGMLFCLFGLAALSHSACGVTSEREQDTWDSLIATPVPAGAFVRAKMLGAAWRPRWVLMLLGAIWSVGLFTGVLSFTALLAVVLVTAVFTWFGVALGTTASLVARNTSQASGLAGVVFLLANAAGPLVDAIRQEHTAFQFLGCMPVVEIAVLLQADGLGSRETVAAVATVIGYGLAASGLTWVSIRNFDRATGRPWRRIVADSGARSRSSLSS